MKFGRYRNTPLSVNGLADSCLGLLHNQTITADVMAATEHVPFSFHPVHDSEFFKDIYWQVTLKERIAAGQKLINRFDRWYERASPLEQIFCAVGALTESDDSIDTLLDDAKQSMIRRHRIEFQDCDDAFYMVPDYHAMRDPFNIANVWNTPQFEWWKQQFELQAARVTRIARWRFGEFLLWNEARCKREDMIRKAFEQNVFTQHGYTVRQGRRVIKRSVRVMEWFFGTKLTREFLQGKPLKIRANYFEWVLKMDRRDFTRFTLKPPNDHVPYRMSLNDFDGNHLGDACVVFTDTPLLDQAVAIGMSVGNPEDELDLLEKTNIFRLTKAGHKNETLRKLNLHGLSYGAIQDANPPPWDDFELEQARAQRMVRDELALQERLDEVGGRQDDDYAFDFPARINVTIYEEEDPFEVEINERVDDLGAIVRLPNQRINEGAFTGHVVTLFHETLLEQARITLMRERDPIVDRLRREMYRRLDVRTDLLEYMAKPEFNFHYLSRLKKAPLLDAFITHGVPLGLGDIRSR